MTTDSFFRVPISRYNHGVEIAFGPQKRVHETGDAAMTANAVEWNLRVSPALDASLREFLGPGDNALGETELTHFVEDAVSKHLFEMAHERVLRENAGVPLEEIEAAVEESLAWARAQMR